MPQRQPARPHLSSLQLGGWACFVLLPSLADACLVSRTHAWGALWSGSRLNPPPQPSWRNGPEPWNIAFHWYRLSPLVICKSSEGYPLLSCLWSTARWGISQEALVAGEKTVEVTGGRQKGAPSSFLFFSIFYLLLQFSSKSLPGSFLSCHHICKVLPALPPSACSPLSSTFSYGSRVVLLPA